MILAEALGATNIDKLTRTAKLCGSVVLRANVPGATGMSSQLLWQVELLKQRQDLFGRIRTDFASVILNSMEADNFI